MPARLFVSGIFFKVKIDLSTAVLELNLSALAFAKLKCPNSKVGT